MNSRNTKWWSLWLLSSLFLGGYYAYALSNDSDHFLPGQTSHGHHQIELACDACHSESFSGQDVIQKACVDCHSEELDRVEDSHPRKKFTDPRNADRLEKLDARYCVTCHTEHRPDMTAEMGVTLPEDFCFLCHEDVANNRPSHKGLSFDNCASAGCHNYHDNKALYEDFLVKHGKEPEIHERPVLPERNLAEFLSAVEEKVTTPLQPEEADMPAFINAEADVIETWAGSAHAQSSVNCSACHMQEEVWRDKPSLKACSSCHESENNGFLKGKHGMRMAQGLSPMSPGQARLPMKQQAGGSELGCHSCHDSHSYDTAYATVDACLSCHDDKHSQAYKESSHFKLWRKEHSDPAAAGTGVSCASCHMPRQETTAQGHARVIVNHNQNEFLRPNEKMVRAVCMQCHGLEFTLNALADKALIERNFSGKPQTKLASIRMALERN